MKNTENKWLADRGYGTGCALGFQGSPEFIKQSTNFAVNMGLIGSGEFRQTSENFGYIVTSMEKIQAGLTLEGELLTEQLIRREISESLGEDDEIKLSQSDREMIEESGAQYALEKMEEICYEAFMQWVGPSNGESYAVSSFSSNGS